MSRRVDTVREAVAAALAEVRCRPVHTVVAAAVAGLLAGPRAPVVVLAAAVLLVVVAGRAALALGLVAALLGGAVLADARLEALDRTALTPRLGHATTTYLTLLEPARARPFGGRTAIAELAGERVLIEASERVRWPAARVGNELRATGILERLRPRDAWLRPRNVHARLEVHRMALTGRSRGGLPGAIDGVRARADAVLGRGVAGPQAALLRGIVLGQDEGLSEPHARGLPRRGPEPSRRRERPERDAPGRPACSASPPSPGSACEHGSAPRSCSSRSTSRSRARAPRSSAPA